MNRRTLLKNTGLLAAGAIGLPSFTRGAVHNILNAGYLGLPFGDIEILVVTDGHGLFKPAQPMFAPGIPADAFEALLQHNFLPAGAVDIAFNVLVLRRGKTSFYLTPAAVPTSDRSRESSRTICVQRASTLLMSPPSC